MVTRIAGLEYMEISKDLVLSEGDHLMLEYEQDNPYDRNAVKVLKGGTQIGYLPKEVSASLSSADERKAIVEEILESESYTKILIKIE